MAQSRALNNIQIIRAAVVVLLGFLASGVLGVVRTAVFSAIFGTSAQLDAFYAAQRIPEMLFVLVAGGALGSSFIPVFSRYLSAEDEAGAWRLASAVMTLSVLAAVVLAIVIVLLAPILVPALLVPGAPANEQALTTSLTQLMLGTTVIFASSGLMMGILNAQQRFLWPALAASTYNIGMIIGALVFARLLPPVLLFPTVIENLNNAAIYSTVLVWSSEYASHVNVYGLALGAVLGAVFHLLIQVPGLIQVRARLRVLLDWRVPGVLEVLRLMGPRVLGLAVVQINFAVNVAFASGMVDGSLVALNTAWFLMFFTLGVLGQSVGTAVFPTLSALVAENDMAGYRERLASAMRSVLFLAFPASVGLIMLSAPIISVLFERGAWTEESTQATAWALSFFAMGIAGHALLEVLSRAFYALSDTWTPVRIGLAAMVSNIVLSFVFIQFIGEPGSLVRGPFAGLALANSVTTLLESAILWWLLSRRMNGIKDRYIINGALKALAAALGMGVVVWGSSMVMIGQHNLILSAVGVSAGLVSFFLLALLLRLEELSILTRRVLRR